MTTQPRTRAKSPTVERIDTGFGISGTAAAMAPGAPPLIMKMGSFARLHGPQPVDRTRDRPELAPGSHFQESVLDHFVSNLKATGNREHPNRAGLSARRDLPSQQDESLATSVRGLIAAASAPAPGRGLVIECPRNREFETPKLVTCGFVSHQVVCHLPACRTRSGAGTTGLSPPFRGQGRSATRSSP